MTYILEIDGTVLDETDYTVVGENIRVKQGLLDGQTLVLYTLGEDQVLARYELYKTRRTEPGSSLLWLSQLGVNIGPEQGTMLKGNLPQFKGV